MRGLVIGLLLFASAAYAGPSPPPGITSLTGGVTATGPGAAAATVVTNANLTGPITSTGNATAIASQTGTGSKFVVDTSPTITTPTISGNLTAGANIFLSGTPTYNLAQIGPSTSSGINFYNSGIWFTYAGTNPFAIDNNGGHIYIGQTLPLVWAPIGSGGGDIGLSRVSAGVLGVGNGVEGDFSGTLKAAAVNITGTSANALAVGPNGTTNPALAVDASTASSATGLLVKSAAAAGGLAVSVQSSGSAENLTINAKGSGTITLGNVSTGVIIGSQNFLDGGQIVVNGSSGYIGYGTGAGGTVTQLTSRTTGVTLNRPTGAITLFTATGSVTATTFTVTDSIVTSSSIILLNEQSGTNLYELFVTGVGSGTFNITFFTTAGIASDAPVINFAVINGATS